MFHSLPTLRANRHGRRIRNRERTFRSRWRTRPIQIALLIAAAAQAARAGGPDGFGYTCQDQSDGVPFAFFDISITGTQLLFATDDQVVDVVLAQPFKFYDTMLTELAFSSNGYLSTSAGLSDSDPTNDCPIPSATSGGGDGRIFVLHDDLKMVDGFFQFFDVAQATGAGLENPGRGNFEPASVFQWDAEEAAGGASVSFEVVLFHDSGDLLMQVETAGSSGASSTTGIQRDAAVGLGYACDQAGSLPDAAAILFTPPSGRPDVAVGVAAGNATPAAGNLVTLTFTASEVGGVQAGTGVELSAVFPGGLTFEAATGDGSFDPVSGLWQVGDLGASETKELQLLARVGAGFEAMPQSTTLTLDAVLPPDPNPANDIDEATVTPESMPANEADLILFVSVQPEVVAGQFFSASGFGSNNGPGDAANVRLVVTLPPGFSLDPDSPADCEQGGNTVVCHFGDLPAFDAVFPDLFLNAPETPGDYTLGFELISDNSDSVPNHSVDQMITVKPPNPGGETVDSSGEDIDPVNTRLGELFERFPPDLFVDGPMPLMVERYYASFMQRQGHVASALGNNWQHNYDIALHLDGSEAKVVFRRGRILFFEENGGNWDLVRRTSVPLQLVESGADFLLGDPRDGRIYTFDGATGLLTMIEDGKGNHLALTYSAGLLDTVGDGLGRQLTFTHVGGLLAGVTDGTRSVAYQHDAAGNLIQFTDADNMVTTFSYDAAHPLPGLMTAHTLAEGNTPFAQTYDAEGRVVTQTDASGNTNQLFYLPFATEIRDALGNSRFHSHAEDGELTTFTDEEGKSIIQFVNFFNNDGLIGRIRDRLGAEIDLDYDSTHHQPTEIDFRRLPGSFKFEYQQRAAGSLQFFDLDKLTYPDLEAVNLTYDAAGNLLTATDEDSEVTSYTYDARGRILTRTNPRSGVETFTYDAAGNLATFTDSDTGTSTLTYDGLNRITGATFPDATVRAFTYDPLGRITTDTDEENATFTYEYDDNGRLTKVTDPLSNERTYTYDGNNRMVSSTDWEGETSSQTFTERGFLESVTNRAGGVTSYDYDARRRLVGVTNAENGVTTLTYDDEDVVASVTNPAGETKSYTTDAGGYLATASDPLGRTVRFGRDSRQRVTELTSGSGNLYKYGYDPRGWLASVDEGLGLVTSSYGLGADGQLESITDPNSRQWGFGYTTAGRPDRITDPLLREHTFQYDTRGRPHHIDYPDGTSSDDTLDGTGRITRRLYSGGTDLNYSYDALGRVLTADGVTNVRDKNGRITSTTQDGVAFAPSWDAGDRMTSMTYDQGQPGEFTVNYEYDALDRVTRVSDTLSGAEVTLTYDAADRVLTAGRSNGVDTTNTYDVAGQRTHIEAGPGASLLDLRYTFDADGKLAEADFVTAPIDPTTVFAPGAKSFGYDVAAQVSSAGYTYDARGRLTAAPGLALGWDGASRLTAINAVSLTYNGYGDLETRTEAGVTRRYYYNVAVGLRPLLAVRNETTAQFEQFFVYHPNGTVLYGIDASSAEEFFYHFDRTGNTLALTDAAGAVTDAYAYAPYGDVIGRSGSSTQPFTFVGEYGVRHEPEGNLYHMRARYFDPHTSRFLSSDPVWPYLAEPVTLNPYQYAMLDPITCIDPAGEFTLIELMVSIAQMNVIAAQLMPQVMRAQRQTRETSAIGSTRTLAPIQTLFRDSDRNADAANDYGSTLEEFESLGLIDEVLRTGTKQGYTFSLSQAPGVGWRDSVVDQANAAAPHGQRGGFFASGGGVVHAGARQMPGEFLANSVAAQTGSSTGNRFFLVDESGVIRSSIEQAKNIQKIIDALSEQRDIVTSGGTLAPAHGQALDQQIDLLGRYRNQLLAPDGIPISQPIE